MKRFHTLPVSLFCLSVVALQCLHASAQAPSTQRVNAQRIQEHLSALSAYLSHRTASPNAQGAAAQTLYQQLGRQALLWSFIDVFRWTSLICFLCVILVWFFKKAKPGKGPVGVH